MKPTNPTRIGTYLLVPSSVKPSDQEIRFVSEMAIDTFKDGDNDIWWFKLKDTTPELEAVLDSIEYLEW